MIGKPKKTKWTAKNLAQVADFFDRSQQCINQWRSRGMPGRPGTYDLREVLQWALSKGLLVERVGGEDLGDGDSPALERYRAARAQLAELELERQKKTLVPRDAIRNGLSRFAHHLRQLAERMGKRHGPEAAITVNEAIDECGRVIDDEFDVH